MKVRLVIPGDPKPMMRPRQGVNKKTGQRIFFMPQTCLFYQQLVRVAALQHKDEIEILRNPDPCGRIFIRVHLTFRNHRHPDPVNCQSNIFDGLGLAIGVTKQTADKLFAGSVTFDVMPGRTEGEATIEIVPYATGAAQARTEAPPLV